VPDGRATGELPGLTAAEAFRTWRFWALSLAFLLAVIATNGTLVHVVAMLTDRGLSVERATTVLSMAGLGVILGRIACGSCLDRFSGALVAVCFYMVPAAGIALLTSQAAGPVPLLGGALCGIGLGANNTLMAYFTSRYFGLKAYGAIFGAMFGVFLVGTGIGPYLNALSFDLLHSYDVALAASSACLIAASLLFIPLGPYAFAPRPPVSVKVQLAMSDSRSSGLVVARAPASQRTKP
jgi:predicted MFS family arabinose efflux permease